MVALQQWGTNRVCSGLWAWVVPTHCTPLDWLLTGVQPASVTLRALLGRCWRWAAEATCNLLLLLFPCLPDTVSGVVQKARPPQSTDGPGLNAQALHTGSGGTLVGTMYAQPALNCPLRAAHNRRLQLATLTAAYNRGGAKGQPTGPAKRSVVMTGICTASPVQRRADTRSTTMAVAHQCNRATRAATTQVVARNRYALVQQPLTGSTAGRHGLPRWHTLVLGTAATNVHAVMPRAGRARRHLD